MIQQLNCASQLRLMQYSMYLNDECTAYIGDRTSMRLQLRTVIPAVQYVAESEMYCINCKLYNSVVAFWNCNLGSSTVQQNATLNYNLCNMDIFCSLTTNILHNSDFMFAVTML